MKLLAIDTATELCGVALTDGGTLVADYRLNVRNVHNEKLVAAIQSLVRDVSWQLADLDGIAVAIGPGSFTGLRIGLSAAKGLAFSLNKPVVAINSMDAFASQAGLGDGPICVVMKARETEIYAARYEMKSELERLSDYMILSFDEFSSWLEAPTLVVASPVALFSRLQCANLVAAAPEFCLANPLQIARLAGIRLSKGDVADLSELEPFYLKEFEPKKKQYYVD